MEPFAASVDLAFHGARMHRFMAELFPLCRSITGNGLRETLRTIAGRIPLTIHEVPTGTQVFDWTIPREWNIRDAWVKNSAGERVIDFQTNNLHVLNYSIPIRRTMSIQELRPHLHTLPEQPDRIPYRTSYYKETWGFCLTENAKRSLPEGQYEVVIDSTLEDGALSYGECFLPGRRTEEILLTTHVCHPSLANDNLSGIAVLAEFAELLGRWPHEYSYRLLFLPGTIGSITWLARNRDSVHPIQHGLVLACLGDSGRLHYKRSRQGDAAIDRTAEMLLKHQPEPGLVRDFSPYGYDERQFCSPGFNLPVGCLSRTPHGQFPEYHTSGDDLDFVNREKLADSLSFLTTLLRTLEGDGRYVNLNPCCEPQLGRRGLYRATGGLPDAGRVELAMLWVLNQSDGGHSLLEIAEKSRLPFELIRQAASLLIEHDLLREVSE